MNIPQMPPGAFASVGWPGSGSWKQKFVPPLHVDCLPPAAMKVLSGVSSKPHGCDFPAKWRSRQVATQTTAGSVFTGGSTVIPLEGFFYTLLLQKTGEKRSEGRWDVRTGLKLSSCIFVADQAAQTSDFSCRL